MANREELVVITKTYDLVLTSRRLCLIIRLSFLLRCPPRKDTTAPWQYLFELAGDATSARLNRAELTAVETPPQVATRSASRKTVLSAGNGYAI